MIEDHPRSCGKDSISDIVTRVGPGSPPLVRERHIARQRKRKLGGITPARAGKTFNKFTTIVICWDHPRSCGKDFRIEPALNFMLGSPPLVRERRRKKSLHLLMTRITPARAGKTMIQLMKSRSSRDHPRSCGKDLRPLPQTSSSSGSPPLVRERPPYVCSRECGNRITPARAGKTAGRRLASGEGRDHPRSCGKDSFFSSSMYRSWGSPPLVRERPYSKIASIKEVGITPARAGKTRRSETTV